jgi:hypothetical protein
VEKHWKTYVSTPCHAVVENDPDPEGDESIRSSETSISELCAFLRRMMHSGHMVRA